MDTHCNFDVRDTACNVASFVPTYGLQRYEKKKENIKQTKQISILLCHRPNKLNLSSENTRARRDKKEHEKNVYN